MAMFFFSPEVSLAKNHWPWFFVPQTWAKIIDGVFVTWPPKLSSCLRHWGKALRDKCLGKLEWIVGKTHQLRDAEKHFKPLADHDFLLVVLHMADIPWLLARMSKHCQFDGPFHRCLKFRPCFTDQNPQTKRIPGRFWRDGYAEKTRFKREGGRRVILHPLHQNVVMSSRSTMVCPPNKNVGSSYRTLINKKYFRAKPSSTSLTLKSMNFRVAKFHHISKDKLSCVISQLRHIAHCITQKASWLRGIPSKIGQEFRNFGGWSSRILNVRIWGFPKIAVPPNHPF